ncbi:MAG: hypothetical protein ACM3U1_11410 [Chloroflexota bacterium]
MKKIAGIDIGTNTILMAIAEYEEGALKFTRDEHAIARLGEKVNHSGRINEDALARAADILKTYAGICREEGVNVILPVATSAMRDALNGKEAADKLSEALGAEVKIIDGAQEAALSLLGTTRPGEDALVIDIGGGSTEYITQDYKISVDIGSVRLSELFFKTFPLKKEKIERASAEIDFNLAALDVGRLKDKETRYAIAGTATTLAQIAANSKVYESPEIHGAELTRAKTAELFETLSTLTPEQIIERWNVHPKRADLIAAGCLILLKSLEKLGAESCLVSVRGLRYGIIEQYAQTVLRGYEL